MYVKILMEYMYLFLNSIKLIDKFCIIQLCNSNRVSVVFSPAVIIFRIYVE